MEEYNYTWAGDISESRVSPDGSKLFVLQKDLASGRVNLLISANDGVSWSTFAAPEDANRLLVNSDGSKLVVRGNMVKMLSISLLMVVELGLSVISLLLILHAY